MVAPVRMELHFAIPVSKGPPSEASLWLEHLRAMSNGKLCKMQDSSSTQFLTGLSHGPKGVPIRRFSLQQCSQSS